MQNDAKLGLILGIAMVMVVAVVFFRRDVPLPGNSGGLGTANVPRSAPAPAANLPGPLPRPSFSPERGAPGHTVSRTDGSR